MSATALKPLVAIACGGTGGHLFPGMAVAGELVQRGCDITLLVSPKEVDQQGVRSATGMDVVTLPAVGLVAGHYVDFLRGAWKSYRAAKKLFRGRPPQAVLAMGGFTSAPPILAGKSLGAATFLHESNTIPGKANRWLARVVDQAFVGFAETADRLANRNVVTTGTPVRPQFQFGDASASRRHALGLDPQRPVLLVMGGSQGASGINELVLSALPELAGRAPELQFIHLTGTNDFEKINAAYLQHKLRTIVRPFLAEMEQAMGAATLAISRSGGSSLAEIAAMRLPSILVPYPAAADNHQYHNARAFVNERAAVLLEQPGASSEMLAGQVLKLLRSSADLSTMSEALARLHTPRAAAVIAEKMLALLRSRAGWRWQTAEQSGAFPNDVSDSQSVMA